MLTTSTIAAVRKWSIHGRRVGDAGLTRRRLLQPGDQTTQFPGLTRAGQIPAGRSSQESRRDVLGSRPGGNDWSREADARRNLDKYVHLALVDNHPMEFRARESGHIGEVRYLRIRPSILLLPGVMGCSTVANRADSDILPIAEALDEIDIEILFFGKKLNFMHIPTRNRYNAAKKAEILIPKLVALEYILNVG